MHHAFEMGILYQGEQPGNIGVKSDPLSAAIPFLGSPSYGFLGQPFTTILQRCNIENQPSAPDESRGLGD